jgi:hypothetical protein
VPITTALLNTPYESYQLLAKNFYDLVLPELKADF